MSQQPQNSSALPELYLSLNDADPAERERALQELWRVALDVGASQPRDCWWIVAVGMKMVFDAFGLGTQLQPIPAISFLTDFCEELAGIKQEQVPGWWRRSYTSAHHQIDVGALIRALAVRAMGQAKDEKAVSALVAALKDPVPTIRALAAEALGNIGHSDAVPPLCDALDDKDNQVQYQAALALGKIGDPSALPVLREKSRNLSFFSWGIIKNAYRDVIAAIEKAAGGTLPRPASEPAPTRDTLPRPAGEPASDTDTLPRPADE